MVNLRNQKLLLFKAIPSNNNSQIAPDSSWFRFLWICSSNQLSTILYYSLSFPDLYGQLEQLSLANSRVMVTNKMRVIDFLTIARTGPELRKSHRPLKKGLSFRSW